MLRKARYRLTSMPDRGIWPLASPLKRGEYLASGLLVYGINHSGHSFKFIDSQYYKLVDQENFHEEGLRWAQSLTRERLLNGAIDARNAAEQYLRKVPWMLYKMSSMLQYKISEFFHKLMNKPSPSVSELLQPRNADKSSIFLSLNSMIPICQFCLPKDQDQRGPNEP